MIVKRKSLALIMLFLSASVVQAEMSTKEFMQYYRMADASVTPIIDKSLTSFQNGLSWANVYLSEERGAVPIYCSPETLVLTGGQLMDVMLRFAEDDKEYLELPYSFTLFRALQATFPCSEN